MQEGRQEHVDNSVASLTSPTSASNPHHSADTDAAAGYQNIDQTTDNETENGKKKREDGNQKSSNGAGYEALDPREVEEARLRSQQPSEYAKLQGDKGGGYEGLDPKEVEEARLKAQKPSVYTKLQGDKLEDLYSLPKKKLETKSGNKKTGNGGGYEGLDPKEVEEARLRAQKPSVYTLSLIHI